MVQTALDAFGRVDIVVDNAGIMHFHKFSDYPADESDEMLAIQFHATWFVTQAAWPHLTAQGYGRVINTVSRGAFFGDPQGAAYAASKGATYGLTRALAVEGRELNIKVNAICPTAWTPLYARAPEVTPERRAILAADFRTEMVAPVVVALAHESGPFTGQVIAADGGHISRMYVAQPTGIQAAGRLLPRSSSHGSQRCGTSPALSRWAWSTRGNVGREHPPRRFRPKACATTAEGGLRGLPRQAVQALDIG